MRARFGGMLVCALAASGAQATEVVFCAPAELREQVRKEILAAHANPIDFSAIDDALFNKGSLKEKVEAGDMTAEPPSTLPAEVQDDWRKGLAACRTRATRAMKAELAAECGAEFAQTAWQRHLERTRPDRVIELRKPERSAKGFSLEAVTYRPAEGSVAGVIREGPRVDALIRDSVKQLLTQKLKPNGLRPNSGLLPGEDPPVAPDLSLGVVQSLPAIKLPATCRLPELHVAPADSPLGKSIAALWAKSIEGQADKAAPPLSCTLSLDRPAPGRRANQLSFHCGASVTVVELFPATSFASDSFQADSALGLTRQAMSMHCGARRAAPKR